MEGHELEKRETSRVRERKENKEKLGEGERQAGGGKVGEEPCRSSIGPSL